MRTPLRFRLFASAIAGSAVVHALVLAAFTGVSDEGVYRGGKALAYFGRGA